MFSEISKGDAQEVKHTEAQNFQDIKPESGMTVSEANEYWDIIFNEKTEVSDGYYNSYETRLSRTPLDNLRGHWEDERGESKYVPSDKTEEGKAARDKLAEKNMDGIEYKYAEPTFLNVRKLRLRFQI